MVPACGLSVCSGPCELARIKPVSLCGPDPQKGEHCHETTTAPAHCPHLGDPAGPPLGVNGPRPEEQPPVSSRSLAGATGYLNTSRPIDIRDLRGKIVLLDFWTYCCINCMHILPMLKQLEEKYPNQLVVLGIHSPKFNTEKDIENIRRAVLRYDITPPSSTTATRRLASVQHQLLADNDPDRPRGIRLWNPPRRSTVQGDRQGGGQAGPAPQAEGHLNETPLRWDPELNKQQRTALRFPGKVIVDPTGNDSHRDSGNHRLIVTDPTGRKTTVIGTGRPGPTGRPLGVPRSTTPGNGLRRRHVT
ncbi:MAG: hypothetical protein CM1200mP2_23130 [Planctomycetaceae bacterium]|nr:MAG: hypothetical protein CM1200mP2_23130 [Planctomycetaceae bacterium]